MVYGCSDPRFILGILLFVVGYIINRWADWKLRSLRNLKGDLNHLPEEQEQQGVFPPTPHIHAFDLYTCILWLCLYAIQYLHHVQQTVTLQSNSVNLRNKSKEVSSRNKTIEESLFLNLI